MTRLDQPSEHEKRQRERDRWAGRDELSRVESRARTREEQRDREDEMTPAEFLWWKQ